MGAKSEGVRAANRIPAQAAIHSPGHFRSNWLLLGQGIGSRRGTGMNVNIKDKWRISLAFHTPH